MFDYSCSESDKEAIDLFVHPGAAWNPYDRYYGEEIVLRWTVLYDEPTEAVLIGPVSKFSVVRVILNKGIVSAVEHWVDDEAKAFLDQYECPPDQIIGLYGKHPLGRIREREAPRSVEGQSLASIIASRSARVDEVLARAAAEKTATEKNARETFLRVLKARCYTQQPMEAMSPRSVSAASSMVTIPPVFTTTFMEGALGFLAISVSSVVAGIGVAIVAGLGAGIGVLCVAAGTGSYITLRELKKRNEKKAAMSAPLQMGEGRLIVPQKGGELIFDLTIPYEVATDWRVYRNSNAISYQTRTILTQGHKTVVFYSSDPVAKDTLVNVGFFNPDDPTWVSDPDSPSFGLSLNHQLKLWRFLRPDSGQW